MRKIIPWSAALALLVIAGAAGAEPHRYSAPSARPAGQNYSAFHMRES